MHNTVTLIRAEPCRVFDCSKALPLASTVQAWDHFLRLAPRRLRASINPIDRAVQRHIYDDRLGVPHQDQSSATSHSHAMATWRLPVRPGYRARTNSVMMRFCGVDSHLDSCGKAPMNWSSAGRDGTSLVTDGAQGRDPEKLLKRHGSIGD